MTDGRISFNLLATSGEKLSGVFLLDRCVPSAVCCAYSRIHLSRLGTRMPTRGLQHCYAKAGKRYKEGCRHECLRPLHVFDHSCFYV